MHIFHDWRLVDYVDGNNRHLDCHGKEKYKTVTVFAEGYECSICGKRKVKFIDHFGYTPKSRHLPYTVNWSINFMNRKVGV